MLWFLLPFTYYCTLCTNLYLTKQFFRFLQRTIAQLSFPTILRTSYTVLPSFLLHAPFKLYDSFRYFFIIPSFALFFFYKFLFCFTISNHKNLFSLPIYIRLSLIYHPFLFKSLLFHHAGPHHIRT